MNSLLCKGNIRVVACILLLRTSCCHGFASGVQYYEFQHYFASLVVKPGDELLMFACARKCRHSNDCIGFSVIASGSALESSCDPAESYQQLLTGTGNSTVYVAVGASNQAPEWLSTPVTTTPGPTASHPPPGAGLAEGLSLAYFTTTVIAMDTLVTDPEAPWTVAAIVATTTVKPGATTPGGDVAMVTTHESPTSEGITAEPLDPEVTTLGSAMTTQPETVDVLSMTYECNTNNPCTAENAANNYLYFSHVDPTKYVSCGPPPLCYEFPCGTGSVWSQAALNCVWP